MGAPIEMTDKILRDLRIIKAIFAVILFVVFLDYLDDMDLIVSHLKNIGLSR